MTSFFTELSDEEIFPSKLRKEHAEQREYWRVLTVKINGYGFIKNTNWPDIFFHKKNCIGQAFERITDDVFGKRPCYVSFLKREDSRGPIATQVEIIDKRNIPQNIA